MKIVKLEEAGFDSALYGFSLSFRKPGLTRDEWWDRERKQRTYKAALANADRDGGHNKFLEHIQVWVSIQATLEWWKQYDTYRIGVSKQSESTMHTLDFGPIKTEHLDIKAEEFACHNDHAIYLAYINMLSNQDSRLKSKGLPQGYLQEREVNLNYKVIRHIANQRFKHRIGDWKLMIESLISQLVYPEFIKIK